MFLFSCAFVYHSSAYNCQVSAAEVEGQRLNGLAFQQAFVNSPGSVLGFLGNSLLLLPHRISWGVKVYITATRPGDDPSATHTHTLSHSSMVLCCVPLLCFLYRNLLCFFLHLKLFGIIFKQKCERFCWTFLSLVHCARLTVLNTTGQSIKEALSQSYKFPPLARFYRCFLCFGESLGLPQREESNRKKKGREECIGTSGRA